MGAIEINDIVTFANTTYTIIFPLCLTYVIKVFKTHSKKKDATDEAVKLILRMMLMNTYNRCMNDGYITTNEYQTYIEVWQLYHDGFNGNLLTDRYKTDIDNLEIRKSL